MIAQQRQQQVAAALETIVGSEEDRFKAAASKIEDSAHRAIDEQDRQVREVGEEISQLVISSRSVGDQIAAGSIASGEALERLAGFREQHRRIVARTPPAARPCAQNFLDLVSNTNTHAARTRTRTWMGLADLPGEQEHQHDELEGHQQCTNPVVPDPLWARI